MATTTGDASNGTTTENGTQRAMGIDYNHSLFLFFTDVSGL